MTVTASYANDLSRVRLSVTNAPLIADYARVERSTDQITWSIVRGGDTVALSAVNGSAINANPYFESGVTSWTVSGGTFAASTAQAHQGVGSGLLTPNGTASYAGAYTEQVPVTPGQMYRLSAWVRCAETRTIAHNVNWYDASHTFLSASSGSFGSTAATWVFGQQTFAAPTGAAFADMNLGPSGTPPATATTYIDEAIIQTTGGTGKLDDYEFSPGVPNYYRASYVDSGPVTFTVAGTAVTGNNASLTPGYPAGLLPGDLVLLFATIRNNAATVTTPAGWTLFTDLGNVRVFALRYPDTGTPATPTVAFTGGVAGDDTIAQIAGLRNAKAVGWTTSTNASAQDIFVPDYSTAYPAFVRYAWKQSVSTATTLSPWTQIGSTSSALGSGSTEAWFFNATGATVPSGTITVTGGVAAISKGITQSFTRADFVTQETVSFTPTVTVTWLKNPRRPNLNIPVTVTDFSAISRPARAGVFAVIGRTLPIAVTDVRGGRSYTLTLTTLDLPAAQDLDARLAQGDPVLLHVPANCPFPGGYYVVGDVQYDRHSARTKRRFFELPLTEVAAPAGSIYSQTATYGDILAAYATYSALLTAKPTYSDVLDYIAPAADVLTS